MGDDRNQKQPDYFNPDNFFADDSFGTSLGDDYSSFFSDDDLTAGGAQEPFMETPEQNPSDWMSGTEQKQGQMPQDGGAPETPDNARYSSDFCTGPLNTWERGSFNPGRAFYCHEYMNLSVKQDSRLEKRFTGVWLPPITRDERAQWLAKCGARRIIYVSCDPATLTRDLEAIRAGYRIARARLFQMFPRTARFETLVELERKGR